LPFYKAHIINFAGNELTLYNITPKYTTLPLNKLKIFSVVFTYAGPGPRSTTKGKKIGDNGARVM